jgi:hypothetical protein
VANNVPKALRAQLEREALRAAQNGVARFKEQNPEAAGLSVKLDAFAFKRRPKELRDAAAKAVRWFAWEKQSVHLSNKALAARFQQDVVNYTVPASLLTAPFSKVDRRNVARVLADRGIELDLNEHNSASKVKRALKAIYAGDVAERSVTVTVTFTEDFVTVGKKPYRIGRSGTHPRIQVDGGKLNVAALKALLCN